MSAANVALRLARREIIRRPWRSLMVVLLVVGPVVALTGLAVLVRTGERSLDERFTMEWGDGDVLVSTSPTEAIDDPILARELGSAEQLPIREAHVRLWADGGHRHWVKVTDLALDHPMVASTVDEVRGRVPSGPDEVLLSTSLADRLGVGVGDVLVLERPFEGELQVVGTATRRNDLNELRIVVDRTDASDAAADLLGRFAPQDQPRTSLVHWTLVDLGDADPSPALVDHLHRDWHDNRFTTHWQPTGQAQLAIVWSWVGGTVAFVIVGVVIAAAFAVTARRQLLLIGQLMGNGAGDRTLRATLFLQGSVVGLLGAVTGIALALGALVVGRPVVEQLLDRRLAGYDVRIGDLIPILVLAAVAATIAALVPARTAVRTSVLQALAGRRPVGPYPNRLVAWGGMAVVAGLLLLAVATAAATTTRGDEATWMLILTGIAGAVSVLLGTCAMSPAIISRLEPLAGRLRGTARLAARSVARQRTRTGAVVAAVAVVAAGAVSGSTIWMTIEATEVQADVAQLPSNLVIVERTRATVGPDIWHRDLVAVDQDLIDALVAVVPGALAVPTRYAMVPSLSGETTSEPTAVSATAVVIGHGQPLLVVDEGVAEAIGISPVVQRAVEESGIVASSWQPDGGRPDEVQVRPVELHDGGGRRWRAVDAALVPHDSLPRSYLLVSPAVAEQMGFEVGPGPTFVVAPRGLTEDERDAIRAIEEDVWSDSQGMVPLDDATTDTTLGLDGVERPGDQIWTEDVTWIEFHQPRWEPSRTLVTAGIVIVATAFSLGVVALGLALSAAETKDERDVLAAIGAPPRALSRLAALKAAVLSTTGTAIGVPLGFIPTVVVIWASDLDRYGHQPLPVVFPWVQVLLLVVAVPAVATLATKLASAASLRLRPVQASTMAFD